MKQLCEPASYGFYYIKDKVEKETDTPHPRITVCIGKNKEGIICKGIAICSLRDNPEKQVGRTLALNNVRRAFKKYVSTKPILRDEAFDAVKKTQLGLKNIIYKSQYNLKMPANKIEKKLFEVL